MTQTRPTALNDAIAACALGLKDGLSKRLIFFSVGLWTASVAIWALVFVFAWAQMKALAAFIVAWSLLGIFVWFPQWLPASAQAKLTGVSLSVGAEALLGPLFRIAVWIALPLMIVVLIIATARIGLELFLMPQISRQVRQHYPAFSPCEPANFFAPVGNAMKTGFIAVVVGAPCLLVPVVNVVLLLVLFGYLNVRTLMNEAVDGIASKEEQRTLVRALRVRMVLLGTLIAGALMIPFVGLIGPSWTGASTCHLAIRELLRQRAQPSRE